MIGEFNYDQNNPEDSTTLNNNFFCKSCKMVSFYYNLNLIWIKHYKKPKKLYLIWCMALIYDTSNGFLSLEIIQETKTSFYEEIKNTITSCNVYWIPFLYPSFIWIQHTIRQLPSSRQKWGHSRTSNYFNKTYITVIPLHFR